MARRRAFVQRPFWSGADARAGTDRQCFRPRVIRLSGLAAVRASRYPVSGRRISGRGRGARGPRFRIVVQRAGHYAGRIEIQVAERPPRDSRRGYPPGGTPVGRAFRRVAHPVSGGDGGLHRRLCRGVGGPVPGDGNATGFSNPALSGYQYAGRADASSLARAVDGTAPFRG